MNLFFTWMKEGSVISKCRSILGKSLFLDHPRPSAVKSVCVVWKGRKEWQKFSIVSVSLLFIIIGGSTLTVTIFSWEIVGFSQTIPPTFTIHTCCCFMAQLYTSPILSTAAMWEMTIMDGTVCYWSTGTVECLLSPLNQSNWAASVNGIILWSTRARHKCNVI